METKKINSNRKSNYGIESQVETLIARQHMLSRIMAILTVATMILGILLLVSMILIETPHPTNAQTCAWKDKAIVESSLYVP